MKENNIFLTFPVIKCKRIILRKMRMKDANAIYNLLSDAKIVKYLGTNRHKNLNETKKYIKFCIHSYKYHGTGEYLMVLKDTCRVIGLCGFRSWDKYNRKAELSGCVERGYQGKNFIYEAITRLMTICFKKMGMNRLEGQIMPQNIPSVKLLSKIGMRYEGTLRKVYYYKNRFHDLKVYSILKKEAERFLKQSAPY